jgi:hypothetical protein
LYKSVADTGWYLENPWLGAPLSMKLYDFPINETGLFLGIKLLLVVGGDVFLAANVYYLLTFLTAAIASLFVLRSLGVGGQVAVAASLLFAFLPYHFWRAPFHPHYSTYHAIPLVAMVAIWLCANEPLFFRRDQFGRLRGVWSRRRTLPAAVACVLTSIAGPYYAFFGTFLIFSGGLIGVLRKPQRDRVLDALAAGGLVAALFAAQLVPNAVHTVVDTPNATPMKRTILGYNKYALRVINLLKETPGHRLHWLDPGLPEQTSDASQTAVWTHSELNEADLDPALGILGSLGVIVLLAVGLAAPCALTRAVPALGDLGRLNLAALLLGLLGGFGELFAANVSVMIRCYNRISIFIAFFALAALALLASRLTSVVRFREGEPPGEPLPTAAPSASEARPRRTRWGFLFVLWAITALGILDQIPPIWKPDHTRDAAAFRSDHEFVAQIERELAPGSMVFQFPLVTFPEFGPRYKMYDYSHFRGYLHSSKIRWSYGAVRGREDQDLQSVVSGFRPTDLVDALVEAGFSGVYIDRNGYEDGGQELIQAMRPQIPREPITSRDGSLVFFKLPSQPASPRQREQRRLRARAKTAFGLS